jgi:hypothetical protein
MGIQTNFTEEIQVQGIRFNAGIKSLSATLPDEIYLLWILLCEPCIFLMYA